MNIVQNKIDNINVIDIANTVSTSTVNSVEDNIKDKITLQVIKEEEIDNQCISLNSSDIILTPPLLELSNDNIDDINDIYEVKTNVDSVKLSKINNIITDNILYIKDLDCFR